MHERQDNNAAAEHEQDKKWFEKSAQRDSNRGGANRQKHNIFVHMKSNVPAFAIDDQTVERQCLPPSETR